MLGRSQRSPSHLITPSRSHRIFTRPYQTSPPMDPLPKPTRRRKWLHWLAVTATAVTLIPATNPRLAMGQANTSERKVLTLLSEADWTCSDYVWLTNSTVLTVLTDENSTRFLTVDVGSGRRQSLHKLNRK